MHLERFRKGFVKGLEGFGNQRTSGDHSNYSIAEAGQNTEKSPRNLRRLAVTQIPVKDRHLRLVGKIHKDDNDDDEDDNLSRDFYNAS